MLMFTKRKSRSGIVLYYPEGPDEQEIISVLLRPYAKGLNQKQLDLLIKHGFDIAVAIEPN